MNCPNCGTPNQPNNRFCLKCGAALTAVTAPTAPAAPGITCPNCGTYNDANGHFCLKCGQALTAGEAALPRPPVSSPPSTYAPPLPPQYVPPYYAPPQTYSPPTPPHLQQPYGSSGMGSLNIWGPFAGYGTRRRHVGWLMDGQGHRAQDLLEKVEAKFKERGVPGAYLSKETLVGRGVMVEMRPYFILRRGLASLALYIAGFGRDLFISQASYLKPPISNFRVIVALVMLTFQAYMAFIYPGAVQQAATEASSGFNPFGGGSSAAFGGLATLLCLIGPVGLFNGFALFVLFCYSGYKWLTEKDALAALRVPPNEFNEDDLMAMEKAVEETVRQSLTDLKLNPDELKAASMGRGGQLF